MLCFCPDEGGRVWLTKYCDYLMNVNITVWCFNPRVTSWIEYVYRGVRDGLLKNMIEQKLAERKM